MNHTNKTDKEIIYEIIKQNDKKKQKLKDKLDYKDKPCNHLWIYRRTHNNGWRYCKHCRIYEDIQL
tara:strand:+ start:1088 stop:1285 length:198 start_codon:yes stop_codon:yes gene_type:complete